MSIDESKGKKAVEGLKISLEEYSDERRTFAVTQDVRDILEYVKSLETRLEDPRLVELHVGDTVEVSKSGNFYNHRVGKIVRIEPFAQMFPYSVSFGGQATSTLYFARHDLLKVAGE